MQNIKNQMRLINIFHGVEWKTYYLFERLMFIYQSLGIDWTRVNSDELEIEKILSLRQIYNYLSVLKNNGKSNKTTKTTKGHIRIFEKTFDGKENTIKSVLSLALKIHRNGFKINDVHETRREIYQKNRSFNYMYVDNKNFLRISDLGFKEYLKITLKYL